MKLSIWELISLPVCALLEMGSDFQNPNEKHEEDVAEGTGEEWCQRQERGKLQLMEGFLVQIFHWTQSRQIPKGFYSYLISLELEDN